MNRIQVFEPALCCATGVCGDEVDQGLVTFSADLDFVRSQGGDVRRYNLASEPLVFAETDAVKGFLQVVGSKGLPLVLVDGVTAMTGGYPSRAQLAEWSGLAVPIKSGAAPAPAGVTMLGLTAAAPSSGGCCPSSTSETGSGCSGPGSEKGDSCSGAGSAQGGCCPSSSSETDSGCSGAGSEKGDWCSSSASPKTAGCC